MSTDEGKPSVLVVEDHPAARQAICHLLARLPQVGQLLTAADGIEAVELEAAAQPALVLMDLRLPGMDGLQAIGRIRSRRSQALIIAHSMYSDLRLAALEAGADKFVDKSVLAARIDCLMNEVVEKSKRGNEPGGTHEHR